MVRGLSVWHVAMLLLVLLAVVGVVVAVALAVARRPGGPSGPALAGPPTGPGVGPTSPPAVADRLAELDDLLRRGAITSQEHEATRARILGDL